MRSVAQPFRWGRRRWDVEPSGADSVEYDPRADRTKLFGEDGEYLGWMDGNPYQLSSHGEDADG